jgi:hypothetical protein
MNDEFNQECNSEKEYIESELNNSNNTVKFDFQSKSDDNLPSDNS